MHAKRYGRVLILAALVICNGCDVAKNVWRSSEDRINEAFPVSAEVAAVKAKVEQLLNTNAEAAALLQSEFAQRQKLRALTCAAGVEPSMSDSVQDIRKRITVPQCFIDFDIEQKKWLSFRRAAVLLLAPPLRPIPTDSPAILSASNSISGIAFAAAAGVAIATSNRELEIIDINDDKSIFLDKDSSGYIFRASLSPNGRVFASASQAGTDAVRLRESETGDLIVELPDYQNFTWLDSTTAWITKKNSRGSELLDIASGKSVLVKGISNVPTAVLPLPGEAGVFIARSHGTVTKFKVVRSGGDPSIELIDQQTTPLPTAWSSGLNALTANGRYLVQGSQKLLVTNLTSLATEEVSLAPYSTQGVTPLPGDNRLLLPIFLPSRGWSAAKFYEFDAETKTFALIEDGLFQPSARGMQVRTVHIPSLNRVGLISDSTVKLLDEVKTSFKVGLQPFLQQLQEDERMQMAATSATELNRDDYSGRGGTRAYGSGLSDAPTNKALADLAKEAKIVAVGVYQSSGAPSRPGQPAGRGPVYVVVRKSSKPIVLVLSSYDPVDWRIQTDSRAELKAVLISSYSDSTVQGAASIENIRMGRTYAYERNSSGFTQLNAEVVSLIGKPIESFQGSYKAASFIVGGM